jgi:hypothetical protein
VGGPAADVSVGRYEGVPVSFATPGVDGAATVRVYLDDEGDGGGLLVATGVASDATLAADLSNVPAGAYRVVVEALGDDGFPVRGEAGGRVTVRDHLSLAVTKGSLVDSAKTGKDKLAVSGTFALDGAAPERLFDPDTETLLLTLGGDSAPYVLRVAPGDPGWSANSKGVLKWKSPKGATPKALLVLDPVKRRFKVKVAKAEFVAAPVNPIHCDLVFGSDVASDTRDWTAVKTGKLVR